MPASTSGHNLVISEYYEWSEDNSWLCFSHLGICPQDWASKYDSTTSRKDSLSPHVFHGLAVAESHVLFNVAMVCVLASSFSLAIRLRNTATLSFHGCPSGVKFSYNISKIKKKLNYLKISLQTHQRVLLHYAELQYSEWPRMLLSITQWAFAVKNFLAAICFVSQKQWGKHCL